MEEIIVAERVEVKPRRPESQLRRWLVGILMIKLALALYIFATLVQGNPDESDWVALIILTSSAAWVAIRYQQLRNNTTLVRLIRGFSSAFALELLIWVIVFCTAATCYAVSELF